MPKPIPHSQIAPSPPASFTMASAIAGIHTKMAMLRNVANTAAGRAGTVLNHVAPNRVLRTFPHLLTSGLALLSSQAVRAKDDTILYDETLIQVRGCVNELSAYRLPAPRAVALCLESAAEHLCAQGDDPFCRTSLDRTRQQLRHSLPQPVPPAADNSRGFHVLEHQFRNSPVYREHMQSLVDAIVAEHGEDVLRRTEPFTLDEVRKLSSQDTSIEDPEERIGQAARAMRRVIDALAAHLYQRRPEWMDDCSRQSLAAWADNHYPGVVTTNSDLRPNQVDRILSDLVMYMNHRYVDTSSTLEL